MKVEVTDRLAVYVDGTRITDRGTKWGTHTILCSFDVLNATDVAQELKARGFERHLKRIDGTEYGNDQ